MFLHPSLPRRIARLLVGLFFYGFAMALMIRANIGVAPWDVFGLGLVHRTGLDFGLLAVAVGALLLLLWIPLRQKPGIGTVLNVLLCGPFADVGLRVLPSQHVWWLQALSFTAGLLLLAVASGIYIGAALGAGPRDGLMLGLRARTGWPIWVTRTLVEGTVLVSGWLLGGSVGVGTLAFALLIGPLVARTIPWLAPRAKKPGMVEPTAVLS